MSDTDSHRLERIAEEFGRIAAAIEARQPDTVVADALNTTHALCAAAASGARSAEARELLTNVQTALETWRTVWPRLGAQREFRQAVAREADLWSRRLQALAQQA